MAGASPWGRSDHFANTAPKLAKRVSNDGQTVAAGRRGSRPLDPLDRPPFRAQCWYPVGGGVETGESLQQAAGREAYEEAGLWKLPLGSPVWTRDHTYRYDGRTVEVHEDWLLHRVQHFDPRPANLTEYETKTIAGFHWWQADDLSHTTDTVFPPRLGDLLSALLRDGLPRSPIDITEPFPA